MTRLTRVDWTMILLPVVVTAIAASMTATPEVVRWFGHEVPVVCMFRRLTGLSCLGCGLTRSFVLLVHGEWADAFRTNPLGPPLYVAMVIQSPFLLWRRLTTTAQVTR